MAAQERPRSQLIGVESVALDVARRTNPKTLMAQYLAGLGDLWGSSGGDDGVGVRKPTVHRPD